MPPKKNAKPNGFMMFVQDFMNKGGKKYKSTKEAVEDADPHWKRMTAEQRRVYDDRARGLRGKARYTTTGENIDVIFKEQQEKEKAEENARQTITRIVEMAKHRGKDALANESFFLIHCNIFCNYGNQFFPAEIAVLKFSLESGVEQENLFHCFVQPGKLPMGYKSVAMLHSEETHLIEIPLDETENNQEDVYWNLKDFLQSKKGPGTKRLPILFTERKNIEMIKSILDGWNYQYDYEEKDLFRVFELEVLFFHLRNAVSYSPEQVWSTIAFGERELNKDVYAYVTEITCEYHTATQRPLYCSKSVVTRQAYVICDNCCYDLNIELEPGRHIPPKSDVPDTASTCGDSSSFSCQSSYRGSTKGKKKVLDSDFETDTDTFDTESVYSDTSTITTFNTEEQSVKYSGTQNSSSVRSYSGILSPSNLPSAFERRMENLSIGAAGPSSAGRGFQPRNPISNEESNFPRLGGRGFRIRHPIKPGSQS